MVSTVISKLELLTDETVMHRSKFHTYLQQETDTIFNFILNILLKGYGNWTFSKQLYNLYRLKPANRSLEQWKGDKELITHLKTTQGRRELFQRKVNQRLTELKGCYCKLTFGGGGGYPVVPNTQNNTASTASSELARTYLQGVLSSILEPEPSWMRYSSYLRPCRAENLCSMPRRSCALTKCTVGGLPFFQHFPHTASSNWSVMFRHHHRQKGPSHELVARLHIVEW